MAKKPSALLLTMKKEAPPMATNPPSGDNHRNGAVKNRSQFKHRKNGLYYKRDAKTGRILDCKTSGGKFKGVRGEN